MHHGVAESGVISMRINKKKLVEALRIIDFTPEEAIVWLDDCIDSNNRYMCRSEIWNNSKKGGKRIRIIFDNGIDWSVFDELKIPEFVSFSMDEMVDILGRYSEDIKEWNIVRHTADLSYAIVRSPRLAEQIKSILKEINNEK